MKIKIGEDEWYPWYSEAMPHVEYPEGEIEITEEEYEWLKKVWDDAEKAHKFIREKLYGGEE